ncbi:MAG: hypothetical protein ABJL99_15210 [Aliishimia sp.]
MAAQTRIMGFMDLIGAEDVRFSKVHTQTDNSVNDLQLQLTSGPLDVVMLPELRPNETLHSYAGVTSEERVFALIDPSAILEADMIGELYELDVRQLIWDEDPETNAQAPYLVAFDKDDPFDALLLGRTDDKIMGIWDRQSPFVIISDRTPEQIAQALQRWLRPLAEHSATPPYLRLWEGATVLALMLCGEMMRTSLLGDIVLGVGPPDHRQMLKLSAGAGLCALPVSRPKISKVGQLAISAAHRATRHRMLASDLHDDADQFDDVLALTRNCIWLGDQVGLQGSKFETILSQLSYDYGWGFMYDAQYPGPQEVLSKAEHLTSVHIAALLSQWHEHVTARIGPSSAARERKRLANCYALLRTEPAQEQITMQELATIDPEKQKLHSASEWGRVLTQWKAHFGPMETEIFDCRTLCLLAYSTGQHMIHDPLRRARIEQIFGHALPVMPEMRDG